MSNPVLRRTWKYSGAKGSELLMLLAIASREEDGVAHLSIKRLAKLTRLSTRHTTRIIKSLEHAHRLEVIRRKGRSNQYHVPTPTATEVRLAIRRIMSKPKRNTIPVPDALRWEVWEFDDFTCQKCGSRRDLTVDHIIPVSKGGSTDRVNLQTLCRSCNSKKGTTNHA